MWWWLTACTPASSDLRPVTVQGTETGTTSDAATTPPTSATGDGAVALNEFLTSNLTGLRDETGAHSDWIELFNPGFSDISLAGWTITDDLTDPGKVPLDPALVVPGGGFLLLWASGHPEDGPDHLAFALAVEGGEIGLYRGETAVDLLRYEPQASDWSAARFPDGTGDWAIDESPTPGAANE